MKKAFLILIVTLLLLTLVGAQRETGNQDDDRLISEVEVVNVLVPVRVFHKGQTVEGLKKSDFSLYDDGELQQINSFQVFNRQINSDTSQIENSIKKTGKQKGRFFVLIFNVFDYHDNVKNAIDVFFNEIYSKNDKVVILTPEKTFNINDSKELIKSIPILKKILEVYSIKSRGELQRIFRLLEAEVDQFFRQYFVDQAITVFMSNYGRIWNEYAKKYLLPDVKKFNWFADIMTDINMQKWVIVFQQREIFPQLKRRGLIEERIRQWIDGHRTKLTTPMIEQTLEKLESSFNIANSLPLKQLQQAFFRANATFHVLMFKSFTTTHSQNFEYSEVASDYENCFRSVSRATGGDIILSNKLNESLKQIAEKKDTYYILSYAPKKSAKTNRKLKIIVQGDKKYDTFYIKNPNLNLAPKEKQAIKKIRLDAYSFKNKRLVVSLTDYLIAKVKDEAKNKNNINKKNSEEKMGLIDMRVMIVHNASEEVVYNEANLLKAKEPKTKLEINFDFLKKGKYHVIIDLHDRLTNKTRIITKKVRI
ncbi:MAG: hypothetical protein GY757_04945 [bacterium]|nr:hypothetical protein [bacterium]